MLVIRLFPWAQPIFMGENVSFRGDIYNGSCLCFLLLVFRPFFLVHIFFARRNRPSRDSELVRYLEDHPRTDGYVVIGSPPCISAMKFRHLERVPRCPNHGPINHFLYLKVTKTRKRKDPGDSRLRKTLLNTPKKSNNRFLTWKNIYIYIYVFLPGDSIRDQTLSPIWRSRFHSLTGPQKGHVYSQNHPRPQLPPPTNDRRGP